MEEDKDQLNRFHGQHNVGIYANQDYEKAFVGNFDQKIDYVKAEAGGDIKGLVAVMDLVEAPEKLVMVADNMPEVNAEIVDQEGQKPFGRAFLHGMEKTVSCKLLCNEEQRGGPYESQNHVVEEECREIGVDRLLTRGFGKCDFRPLLLEGKKNEKREEGERDENVADKFSECLGRHSSPLFLFDVHGDTSLGEKAYPHGHVRLLPVRPLFVLKVRMPSCCFDSGLSRIEWHPSFLPTIFSRS